HLGCLQLDNPRYGLLLADHDADDFSATAEHGFRPPPCGERKGRVPRDRRKFTKRHFAETDFPFLGLLPLLIYPVAGPKEFDRAGWRLQILRPRGQGWSHLAD